MINSLDLITNFPISENLFKGKQPWEIIYDLKGIIKNILPTLNETFTIENGIAIHPSAMIEQGVILKPPMIILQDCKIGANAYFREGVILGKGVKIGPSCEIKSSIICSKTAIAHFNYVGNSIIGSRVNFEAGSIAANHYNERTNKEISVLFRDKTINTGVVKFGALVGDDSRIGANAVLSPGTILEKKSIIKRLELVEQIKGP